jgi:rod shape-determining protein MreC
VPVLGPSVQRSGPTSYTSRAGRSLRRRVVVGLLIFCSLVLITISFREANGGPLHRAQGAGATVLHPFQVAAERVARPFRDVYGYFDGLVGAKSENAKLQKEVRSLRQKNVELESAAQQNVQLKALLDWEEGPRFPQDYRQVNTFVIAPATSDFDQEIGIAAGSKSGIRLHDPVATADGLVGEVTAVYPHAARVTLLTDPSSNVSAVDLTSAKAHGLVHTAQGGASLVLDWVTKDKVVHVGDTIITAGSLIGRFGSIYPRGIRVGVVTSVGQTDTQPFKQIQVDPFVDFSSLDSVAVLVSNTPRPEFPIR